MKARLLTAFAASALIALVTDSSAGAAVTIGSALQTEPVANTDCSHGMTTRGCLAVDDFIPGRTLVVPATGTLVAWNVRLGAGTEEQTIRIRVVRHAAVDTFTIISSGPLESVPAGAGTYSFPVRLPVNVGDQIAMDAGSGTQIVWRAPLPGAVSSEYNPSPLDGETTEPPVFTNPGEEHTFNAVLSPTNTFSVGAVTRNKRKGTATITATVPNPGDLTATGKGVKASGAAVTSKAVGAGTASLTIRAKGKKKRKLNDTGKVKLNAAITFTPTGGDPRTQSRKVKLKKKLKKL